MMPGRAGPPTVLSHQFVEPPGPRHFGGMSVELFDNFDQGLVQAVARKSWRNAQEITDALRAGLNRRAITFNAECIPGPGKYVELGDRKDRFGDPFLHVRYELDDFDRETYGVAKQLAQRFGDALHAEAVSVAPIKTFWSAHHHLGTCRMGHNAKDSVVDSLGRVHDTEGLYLCGGSSFVTTTALQPTLTMVALAMRTGDQILQELA
jgi:choline dehydrogenase-like flavoprotein